MPKSKMEVSEDGFTVFWPNGIEKVSNEDITEIAGYKTDLITTDLVCLDIETVHDECVTTRTIHEEMVGFPDVMKKLQELPGFYQLWWEAVVLPPFEQNYTLLYRRGVDLSQADEPVRLELAVSEPWPLKKKIRIWATVVAIIAAIVIFHKVMDFLRVDRCLDAGGAWDEQQKRCQGNTHLIF